MDGLWLRTVGLGSILKNSAVLVESSSSGPCSTFSRSRFLVDNLAVSRVNNEMSPDCCERGVLWTRSHVIGHLISPTVAVVVFNPAPFQDRYFNLINTSQTKK